MGTTLLLFNQWLLDYLPKLFGAVVILAVGFLLARSAGKLIRKSLARSRIDVTLHSFISNAIKITIQIIVLVSAAGAIGIPTTSFITILGGAAVAISLALQNSLSNVASGLLLLLNRSFRVGDYVELNDKGGTVESISLISTALITTDGKRIIVPNATMTSQTLINYSTEKFRRVDFTFGVSHESDLPLVQKVLADLAAEHPLCLDEPEPLIAVRSLDEGSVKIVAFLWCERAEYWNLLFDFNERAKHAFDEHGIVIPYPQVVVHQAQTKP